MSDRSQSYQPLPKLSRVSATSEVAAWCRARNLPAYIVGRWVWVEFDSKPDSGIREALKANGFRWSRRRGAWAHPCGHFTGRGSCDPFWKYGKVAVGDLADELTAVAS